MSAGDLTLAEYDDTGVLYAVEPPAGWALLDVDDLRSQVELAEEYGVTRGAVGQWITRDPDFPAPVIDRRGARLWSARAVAAWRNRS
jgi:hypothetical protein